MCECYAGLLNGLRCQPVKRLQWVSLLITTGNSGEPFSYRVSGGFERGVVGAAAAPPVGLRIFSVSRLVPYKTRTVRLR